MGSITRTFANNISTSGKFDATQMTGTLAASNIADASVTNITDVPGLVSVSTVASDPPSPDNGQMWYNTTTKLLKAYVLSDGSWASGGNLNTGREGSGGAGTQTAGLISGGNVYPNSIQNKSEEYDGSSWTEGNNLNTARRKLVGAGLQTSAVVFGGTTTAPVAPGATGKTEEYDGTSYTEQNDFSTGRLGLSGSGLQTAAWAAGGYTASSTYSTTTDVYDGTSWTTSPGTLNTGRSDAGQAGISTAALMFGGTSGSLRDISESWDGTSWTEGNDLPAAVRQLGSFGTQTTAMAVGGEDASDNSNTVAKYDGTSWTTVASLALGREHLTGSGYGTQSGNTGLVAGGSQNGNPMNAQTEEWEQTLINKRIRAV